VHFISIRQVSSDAPTLRALLLLSLLLLPPLLLVLL